MKCNLTGPFRALGHATVKRTNEQEPWLFVLHTSLAAPKGCPVPPLTLPARFCYGGDKQPLPCRLREEPRVAHHLRVQRRPGVAPGLALARPRTRLRGRHRFAQPG